MMSNLKLTSLQSAAKRLPWLVSLLFLGLAVSGLTGSAIPISLCRLGVDPAVASGPLITTVSDLCALVCYYSIAHAMLVR